MKLEYLKEKKQLVPFALLGVSVLLAILIVVKVRSFFATSAQAESIVKKAVAQGEADPNILKESTADAMKIADGLKRRNLFAPPLPKQNPVSSVLGILGNEALINGKWYKTGDMVGDAKVVAIEPTRVKVEWNGQEKYFAPIMAASAAAPGGPGRPGGSRLEGGPEGPGMAQAGPGGRPMFEGGMMGMRERFESMSEEERRAMRERMLERFGGRGGPGMGGMGGRPGGDRGGGERRPGGDMGGGGRRPGGGGGPSGGGGRGPGGGGGRR